MEKLSNKFIKEDLQRLVEDLEETLLRLHVNGRGEEEKYDQFKKVKKLMCGKMPIKIISAELRKEMERFREYIYYRGKIYAYSYVLKELGSEVPHTIERLRGVKPVAHNTLMETKAHYTEVKGHFPTDEAKAERNKNGQI